MSISKLVLSSSLFIVYSYGDDRDLHSFPTRRSSDLARMQPREDLRVPLRPLARSDRRRRHDDDARLRSAGTLQDRKSTRLNSSHSQISYAVFCLKKKNNIQPYVPFATVLITHNIIAL